MTFPTSTHAPWISRPAGHSAVGPSPFTAPAHKTTQPALRTALPDAPDRIPADPGASAPEGSRFALAPPLVHQALAIAGQPLDIPTRVAMEQRFGCDFRHVRIHTGETAAASARAVDSQAYAVGEHLVFNRDRYAPRSVSGRRLLMHELAHVAQHSGLRAPGNDLPIDSPDSAAERSANLAIQPRVSAAVLGAQFSGLAPSEPILHRAVDTWGGQWDTTKYEDVTTDGKKNGADIELHFKPGAPVDATKIGIVQSVAPKSEGAFAYPDDTMKSRAVPAGKSGEGSAIDQLSKFRNPLYATGAGAAGDKLPDTPTSPAWGQHGFRFTDAGGALKQQDAIMKDTPTIIPIKPNSQEVFEDTALALTGAQAGANYGSVQWGWKTDAAGALTRLPLSLVSKTVPSAGFKEAETMWNKSKDSAGKDLIKFTTASEKFIQTDNVPLVSNPADAAKTEIAKLAQNTSVEVVDKGDGQPFNPAGAADKWVKITITDSASIGKTGWVRSSQLADTKVKANAKP